MTKNWKKITGEIFFFFLSKTAIYLSLSLHKVCPSYRRSLQFSKEAIQHFKTWTFTNYCLLLWVIFALLDPDPYPDSEYGSGSGSTDPIEYGSNTDPVPDPDPQPWLKGQPYKQWWGSVTFWCGSVPLSNGSGSNSGSGSFLQWL